MKMKKLLLILSMVFIANFIFAQTCTVTIGSIYDPPAGVVNVPLTLTAIDAPNPWGGLDDLISGFAFYMEYDASVLGNTVTFSTNPFWTSNGTLVTNVMQNNPVPGTNTIAFVWATGGEVVGTAGQLFTNMQFNYTEGATGINWATSKDIKTISYMVDYDGNDYIGTWINGCVCISGFDITFQVADDNGIPLQGALVTIGTESKPTDANGEAVFNRPDGNYPYTITNTGYYTISNSVTVAGAAQTIPVTMYPLGSQLDVTFHVTDGTNDLEGALVSVGSQSGLTDINGEVIFSLPNGNYNYNVSKYGYTSDAGTITVAGTSQTIDVTLIMLPHYDITFHVTSGGNNIDGASINIPGVGILLTNVNGIALFSLIDGTYNYTITKTGFAVKTGTITVAGAAFTVEETLIPLYTATFHVTAGGANLQGATVTVGTQSVVTNAGGNAVFNLPNGSYSYTVTKTGYINETGNFDVTGANLLIEVAMSPVEYSITFHVTSGGNNLGGVLIELDNDLTATTNTSGIAVILLPDGDYVYTATLAGYGVEQDLFTVNGSPMNVNIIMTPLPTYAVTFHVTANGANLDGADVTIGAQTITTNSNGIAVFNLLNGTYSYTVTKLGYIGQNGNFLVLNQPLMIPVDMPLFEWTITFHVTSSSTNVTGATVTVNPGNLTALTGPNGNATFNLPNGSYTYEVTKTGYITQTGNLVVLNANQTVEVDLPFGGWETKFHCIVGGVGLAGVDVTCDGETKTTDANGDAFFYLQNGTYTYTAEKFCYVTATGTVIVNNAAQTKNVIMTLQQFAVTFVLTHNAVPIPDASVTLAGVTQVTGDDGTTVFMKVNGTYNYSVSHPDYGTVTGTVTVNCAPWTEQIFLDGLYDITSGSFNVYPNPSNGTFSITTSAIMGYESNVTVYDLTGKPVYTGKLEGNDVNVIDLSGNGKGMYIMQIIVEGNVYNKTLIIQ
jgi:uncharacterized membrane protein